MISYAAWTRGKRSGYTAIVECPKSDRILQNIQHEPRWDIRGTQLQENRTWFLRSSKSKPISYKPFILSSNSSFLLPYRVPFRRRREWFRRCSPNPRDLSSASEDIDWWRHRRRNRCAPSSENASMACLLKDVTLECCQQAHWRMIQWHRPSVCKFAQTKQLKVRVFV